MIAGQWPADLGGLPGRGLDDGYLDRVPLVPAGVSTYLSLPAAPAAVPAGGPLAGNPLLALLRQPRLRHAVLHLSVTWAPEEFPFDDAQYATNLAAQKRLVNGELDGWIDALARWCRGQDRTILLRPGYEFNRVPGDRYYDRRYYVPAFRRIVRRFRALGVRNVAFVWASSNISWSSTDRHLFDAREPDDWDFESWYPGDRYVDWFGFSYWFPRDRDTVMMREARRRSKPVLLAETTPAGFNLGARTRFDLAGTSSVKLTSQQIWDAWFGPYFAFIRRNRDVIAGLHYISTDWRADPAWSKTPPFIGSDARLWKNPAILRRWTREISRPQYLNAPRR